MIKFTSFLFSSHFVVLCAQINNNFRCDYNYNAKAKFYFKYHEIPANWYEARLRCTLEGATLGSPLNSNIIHEFLSILEGVKNKAAPAIFTGVHAAFSRGDFHSIEGNPLYKIPHRWAKNEPNNKNDDESCLVFMFDGAIADKSCREIFPYVCYKKLNPTTRPNECGTIDSDYKLAKETGNCYKFHRLPRIFSRAFMTCSAEGGYLTIIDDKIEAKVIKNLFTRNPKNSMRGSFWKDIAYVGFHDWFEPADFRTIHGIPIYETNYDRFANGEPNNSTGDESCGTMLRSAEYNDRGCNRPSAFICEKDPMSLICK